MPSIPLRAGYARSVVLWSCVLAGCIGVIIYVAVKPGPTPPPLPLPPSLPEVQTIPSGAVFFEKDVQPVIATTDRANRESANRCVQRLQEMFAKHRRGISPFVEDLTSWGTRFAVLRRMPSDWWYSRSDVQATITAKFEKHLFSDESLHQGIQIALEAFRKEIEANNNVLLTAINAAVSRRDLPNIPVVAYGDFSAEVAQTLQGFAKDAAVDSVTNLLITEIASGVGGEVAAQLVVAIAARIAVMAATSSATAGGATVGGAAAGGGGGSFAGPVGSVIGLAVGLVVGIAIDWWMTSSFNEKLTAQLGAMIDEIEGSVLQGVHGQPGLRVSLDKTCDALCDAYRQSLYERIVRRSVP